MEKIKTIFFALNRAERWVVIGAASCAAISAVALFVLFLKESTVVVPAHGGEYAEATVGQPRYVNPILASSDVDKALVRLVFSNVRDLAQKIDVEENGRLWRVRLAEGILWSDGARLTADDVIFTVQKVQDPETQSPLFISWQGVTVTRVSELELEFHLVNPYPFFEDSLRSLYLLPRHLFASTPSSNWRLSEYNLQPVGSGPYRFDAYEKEPSGFITRYRFRANDRFFGTRPFIDRFDFLFFKDIRGLYDAWNRGAADGFSSFDPGAIEELRRPYELHEFPLPSYYAVFINQGQNLALKEREVRQALDLAADRERILREALGGRGTPLRTPLGLAPASTTSPALHAAQALLESAGWKIHDDVREKTVKNVTIRLEFELAVPQIASLEKTAEMLKSQWGELGARVNIVTIPPQEIAERTVKNREYQAILFGNFLNPPRDLYPFWHSSERFYPGLNLALYNVKRADDLIDRIRRSFDAGERTADLETLDGILRDDVPAVILYSPRYLSVTRKDLRGIPTSLLADPADRLLSVASWYLRTARTLK